MTQLNCRIKSNITQNKLTQKFGFRYSNRILDHLPAVSLISSLTMFDEMGTNAVVPTVSFISEILVDIFMKLSFYIQQISFQL